VAQGARFVGFPECSITGYRKSARVAIALDSPEVAAVLDLARRLGVHVAAGLVERCGGRFYNTQVLAGPRGMVGFVRKVHPTAVERRFFSAGDELPVFRVGPAVMGIPICADATHYETPRALTLRGADVIFAPHATYLEHTPASWLRWRERRWGVFAADCCAWFVGCNNAGRSERAVAGEEDLGFASGALVVGPDGQVVARSRRRENRETMLVADLDLSGVTSMRRKLFSYLDLRADLFYRDLL
jgi:predicted amidohydrolase